MAGGTVERLSLMTGGPGAGDLPMAFHGSFVLAAPLAVVAGAANSGIAEDSYGSRIAMLLSGTAMTASLAVI